MKFSIITSCFNAEKYISETVESVCQQTEIINKNCELQYIIIDGNSTDKTNIILNDLKKKYPFITHIIEKDDGLYDGLSKGFKLVGGDVMGYLNAGDFLNKTAFSVLKKVFGNKKINWVTGLKIIYNENSEITKIQIPYNYRSNLIRCGAYGKYLPFIQQESTFWRPELIKNLDIEFFRKLEKSGDMYLWYNFARKNDLYIINSYLSGFKYHDNQLTFRETGSTDLYLTEAKKFINKPNVKDLFFIIIDLIPWYLGRNISNIFNFTNSKFIDYLYNEKWQTKTKTKRNKIYCWASDFEKTNGEGITANLFLKNLFNNNDSKKEDIFIKNTSNKLNYFELEKVNNTVRGGKLNILEKYLDPFFGIFYLWYKFLTGNKVVFINFLPLWNFIVLLLLPPGTILGPITGTTVFSKNVNGFEKFFRKYLMPIQFQLSNLILLLRYKNLTFNTSNLKSILSKKVIEKSKFNFIYTLYDLESKNLNVNKEFDFIFYIRTYPSKGTTEIVNFINLLKKDFKIMTVGEKLNIQEIHEHGLLSRDHVLELCKKTKFTIISSENFYSLFSFDCISNGVKVFFDEKMSYEKTFEEDQKVFPISFDNLEEACQKIIKKIKDLS
jgi:glycosyltransferase involved in cell wall biosynthesis